jgi:hypothetical protein
LDYHLILLHYFQLTILWLLVVAAVEQELVAPVAAQAVLEPLQGFLFYKKHLTL